MTAPAPPRAPRRRTGLAARLRAGLAALVLAAGSLTLSAPGAAAVHSTPPALPEADAAQAASQPGPSGTSDAAEAPAVARIAVDSVSPWVEADGALEVTGRIVNGSSDTLSPSVLALSRSSSRLASRTEISDWVDAQPSALLLATSEDETSDGGAPDGDASAEGDEDADTALEVPDLPASLAPGESAEFSFTVPAETLRPAGSPVEAWGALGLVVSLAGTTASAPAAQDGASGAQDEATDSPEENPAGSPSAQPTAVQLSAPAFTVWHPDPGVDPTVLSALLPVTLDAPAADGGPLVEPEVLERAADPSAHGAHAGALDRTLTAANTLDDAALAVDPRLLASVRAALELPAEEPADPAAASGAANGESTGEEAEGGSAEGGSAGENASDPASAGQDPGAEAAGGTSGTEDATAPGEAISPDSSAPPEGTLGPQEEDGTEQEGSEGGNGTEQEGADAEAPDGSTADPEAAAERLPRLAEWYAEFTRLAADREVVPLPWADADMTALRLAAAAAEDSAEPENPDDPASLRAEGLTGLLGRADAERGFTGPLADSVRTDIVWPAAGTVRDEDLAALADRGAGTIVLADDQRPSITTYTSSAHSTMGTDGDPQLRVGGSSAGEDGDDRVLDTLIADSGLSRAAAEQASGAPRAPGQTLAVSAAITAERPFDSRHLLLTLPREGAGSALPELAEQLSAAPWLSSETLTDLGDTEPVARGSLEEPEEAAGGQQAADLLSELGEAHGSGSEAAAVFVEAGSARRDMARSLLSCAATRRTEGIRAQTEGAGAAAEETADCSSRAQGWVSALAGGVRPEPGSSVLLVTGEQAHIPVHVENSTNRTARIRLRVEASTPQLSTEESEPLELGPGESRSVDVPVRGLANADVRAQVRVLGMDGTRMPQSTDLLVRVRADWENTATIAVGSALALVLVFGLVRTIRRGRPTIPKSQLDAAVARAQDD